MGECKECLYYEVCPLGLVAKGKTGICLKFKNKADFVEVKHGKWIKESNTEVYWYVCSVCGEEIPRNKYGGWTFFDCCPNCGAKMDGKEDA